ncbi:L-rhamnose mutarotase [Catenovulum agarivorans DS-2]|uniref:L-rhamnose mutarotase n=1 Tax=Catenovulum agarivorans DS-2 TaxID=1328313 RepID=W7QEY9_9ALTE|nr:L-rhamnose mutarotase [Catenovulum agarivorans]EWH10491.1 L-rhamnose mutarotase [Catenovulum agarivorans DS-2]
MEKLAFTMKIYPGQAAEYKKRHDEIWPELSNVLKDAGISDYSIFLDEETCVLFAVLYCESKQKVDALPSNPVVQKWWAFMAEIMQTNDDNSPVSKPLKQVFHLD